MFFSSQIFGFASDPFVNIFKFYYVMVSNMVSLLSVLWHLLNLPFWPSAGLVFVKELCVLKNHVFSVR